MPYPLPSDTAGVSGVTWKLIAVPDDPAYTRAALDRYSGISDVWNWGKEGVVPDSYVARQQWLTAVLLTLELWDMNPLDTIIDHIDEVEALLGAIRDAQQTALPCCDSTLFNPPPAEIDEATDAVPLVIQTNYTTGNDWGNVWNSYMCPLLRQAWTRIDDNILEPWEYYINLGGGGVAVLTTLYVAWAGIGAAVVVAGFTLADFLALFAAVKGYIGDLVMGDYSDWDTHADDFICAVRDADGPAAKQTAAEDFIDGLSYSAPVKLLARFAFHSGFWKQVYSGVGADGNEITGVDDGLGCPTCVAPEPDPSLIGRFNLFVGSSNTNNAQPSTCTTWSGTEVYSYTAYRLAGDNNGLMAGSVRDPSNGAVYPDLDIQILSISGNNATGSLALYNGAGVNTQTLTLAQINDAIANGTWLRAMQWKSTSSYTLNLECDTGDYVEVRFRPHPT